MTRFAVLSLLLCLAVSVQLSWQDDTCGNVGDSDTLIFTLTVFRHGDRTPYTTYPNDKYNAAYWAQYGGFGQLIPDGMRHHYEFGQWFRGCYANFLNDTYSYHPQNLWVRSTDYDRTLQSAESHLAGAYPPLKNQQWNPDLGEIWQPIPIHTIPQPEDYLLITDIKCPPYQKMIDDVWANAPKLKAIQAKYQEMLDFIATKAGLHHQPGDLNEVQSTMCDAVHVETLLGLDLPDWMNTTFNGETVLQKLHDWQDIWIIVELANDEMIKYAGGQLIDNLIQVMQNKSHGHIKQKHYIYSAHDTTVGTLLGLYGDFNQRGPPYRSAVITELHYDKSKKNYFVRAFFRNDTELAPWPLSIRNCTFDCPLDEYVTRLQPLRLPDKKSTCYAQVSSGLDENAIIAIASTTSIVVVLIVATVVFLLLPVFKKRNNQDGMRDELVNN